MNADPASWFLVAKDLHKVALLIAERIEADWCFMEEHRGKQATEDELPYFSLGGVFWLNAGYCLENMLKGLAVHRNPSLVQGNRLSKELTNHRLLKLAALAKVPVSGVEGYFLWIAERSVKWAGRYPTEKTDNGANPTVFSLADITAYRQLYTKLCAEYEGIPQKRRRYEWLGLGHE